MIDGVHHTDMEFLAKSKDQLKKVHSDWSMFSVAFTRSVLAHNGCFNGKILYEYCVGDAGIWVKTRALSTGA